MKEYLHCETYYLEPRAKDPQYVVDLINDELSRMGKKFTASLPDGVHGAREKTDSCFTPAEHRLVQELLVRFDR